MGGTMCCGEVGSLTAGVIRVRLRASGVELGSALGASVNGGVVICVNGNRGELFWGTVKENSGVSGLVVAGTAQLTLRETRVAI